jgi:hypothetical protein
MKNFKEHSTNPFIHKDDALFNIKKSLFDEDIKLNKAARKLVTIILKQLIELEHSDDCICLSYELYNNGTDGSSQASYYEGIKSLANNKIIAVAKLPMVYINKKYF